MEFLFSLLTGFALPALPTLVGWVVWLSLLGLLVYNLYRWRGYRIPWKVRETWLLVGFLFLTLIASPFIYRLPFTSARAFPGLPAFAPGSALMPFFGIPWTLGAALLGPLGGIILGAFAGLVRGAVDSYTLFSVIELAMMGSWYAVNTRQRYRTPAYGFLRQPLVSALILVPFHTLFYVIASLFTQWGADVSTPIAARLDFALSNAGIVTLLFGSEMLVAGTIGQVFAQAFPGRFIANQTLQPSPGERSLETRFLSATGTFISLLLLTLLVGDWFVAGRSARDMLHDRLSSAA
ncbi:MAG: hypothetical protein AB1649_20035, partial [Chloroflexota bacterium]